MRLFITYSPRQGATKLESYSDVNYVFTHVVHALLQEHYALQGVTSWGENHGHYHFHIHVLSGGRGRVDNLRRSITTKLLKRSDRLKELLDSENVRWRWETQKGKCRDVSNYLMTNLEQNIDNYTTKIVTTKKYTKLFNEASLEESILSAQELYLMLHKRSRLYAANADGGTHLTSIAIQTFIQDIASEGYALYKVRDDELDRMIDSLIAIFGNKRYDRYTHHYGR